MAENLPEFTQLAQLTDKEASHIFIYFFFSFGRRITILIFMITLTFSSLGAAFSPNMETFIVIRLAIAASAVAVWTTGFVYSKIFFPFPPCLFPHFCLFSPYSSFSLFPHTGVPHSASILPVWISIYTTLR